MEKSASRQNVYAATQRVPLADIESGTPFDVFTKLPNGVIPIALAVIVLTPFDSVTSDVLDIGTAAAPNAYANDIDVSAPAGTKADATLLPGLVNEETGGLQLQATWTSAGGLPTEGEIVIVGQFVEQGREHFTQG